MKVVLFCGGLGMRMREHSEAVPKPMVSIGYRPILWHVMKYYAHHGHKDFILCLGYKGDVIKNYFLQYNECQSNDFVLTEGGRKVQLLRSDIEDWRITFVDTGISANVGQRLKAVERHLQGEELFLANYTDGLSDVLLPAVIEGFRSSGRVACFVSVKPKATFHMVSADAAGVVKGIQHIRKSDIWINGGFFVFRRQVFDYIRDGEELVEEPFHRLIAEGQLFTYVHAGFWTCMDTYKERQELEDMFTEGREPWTVWQNPG